MNGYSTHDSIYFQIHSKIGFARLLPDQSIWAASYSGTIPETPLKRSPELLANHAAEHQAYNAFMKKISKLSANASLNELAEQLPSLDEIKAATAFNFACGSTVGISCLFLVINSVSIFISKLYYPLAAWQELLITCGLALFSLICAYLIQKQFFLGHTKELNLKLAQAALSQCIKT